MEDYAPHSSSGEQNTAPTTAKQETAQALDVVEQIWPLLQPIIEQLNHLHGLSQKIDSQLDGLQEVFQQKIQDDNTKATLFNQLHQELMSYREDFVFKHTLSRIFDDLIHLYDRLGESLEPDTLEHLSREDLIERLRRTQGQVGKILDRQGVEMIENSLPMVFDPTCQEAFHTVPVSTSAENEQVRAIKRRGFIYRGHMLRPEKVVVGVFQQHEE